MIRRTLSLCMFLISCGIRVEEGLKVHCACGKTGACLRGSIGLERAQRCLEGV